MAKVELKQPVVEEISNLLKEAKSAVLVDYRGLTVEQDTELRRQLRAAGVNYKVYKNTMINFAIQGTDFEPLKADLEGPTALATSATDETAPARVLNEFGKKADKLELKSGVVDDPRQGGAAWQAAWKHPVSHHQSGPGTQPDCGSEGGIIGFSLRWRSVLCGGLREKTKTVYEQYKILWR